MKNKSYEEGTSPSDSIVNASPAEKVVLAVSFGTSYNQSRALTIGGIEAAFREAFPQYGVRRAFTSQRIMDKLARRDGLKVDNVEQAMQRLVADKVKEVVVQPTTVLSGCEYDDMIAAITPYAKKFECFCVGKPLLTDDRDYNAVAQSLLEVHAPCMTPDTAIIFMGHGTFHRANASYAVLESVLREKGNDRIFIGTVEGGVLIEDILPLLSGKGIKKVVLRPLMVVAGDHANNDMAGTKKGAWKNVLAEAGYEVNVILEGLGQIKAIRALYVQHAKDAIGANAFQDV